MAAPTDPPFRRLWLSVDEAAAYTGIGKTTLYEALQAGELVGSQRSKHSRWRVHVNDLDAWLRSTSRAAS